MFFLLDPVPKFNPLDDFRQAERAVVKGGAKLGHSSAGISPVRAA